jgi:protein-arginine kinase activator protein McsA
VLQALRKEIRRYVPEDPIRKTKKLLDRAISEERYEEAARLRDELESLRKRQHEEA